MVGVHVLDALQVLTDLERVGAQRGGARACLGGGQQHGGQGGRRPPFRPCGGRGQHVGAGPASRC